MRVDLAGSELLHGVGVAHESEVFSWIEPDPSGHQRNQLRATALPNSLPLQVGDRANVAVDEQFVAAAMHAGDDGDRSTFIDADDVMQRQIGGEIDMPAPQLLRYCRYGDVQVTDLGEALRPQQLFADILRRKADDR